MPCWFAMLVIFIASLLTGFAVGSVFATGLLVAIFCFIFSMIGVYGARAGSIGLAGLFVMVLNLSFVPEGSHRIECCIYSLRWTLVYAAQSFALWFSSLQSNPAGTWAICIQSIGDYIFGERLFMQRIRIMTVFIQICWINRRKYMKNKTWSGNCFLKAGIS